MKFTAEINYISDGEADFGMIDYISNETIYKEDDPNFKNVIREMYKKLQQEDFDDFDFRYYTYLKECDKFKHKPYYDHLENSKKRDEYNNVYLKDASLEVFLECRNVEQLKDILRNNNLKVSGAKKVLIERILSNLTESEIRNSIDTTDIHDYELTEEGKNFLQNKICIDYYKKYYEYSFLDRYISKKDYLTVFDGVREDFPQVLLNYLEDDPKINLIKANKEEFILYLLTLIQIYKSAKDDVNLNKTYFMIILIIVNDWYESSLSDEIVINIDADQFNPYYYQKEFIKLDDSFINKLIKAFNEEHYETLDLQKIKYYIKLAYEELKDQLVYLTEEKSIHHVINLINEKDKEQIMDDFLNNKDDLILEEETSSIYKRKLYLRIALRRYLLDIDKYGQSYTKKYNYQPNREHYYDIPEDELELAAKENHYMKKANAMLNVEKSTVDVIKDFLKTHGLKVSGKKADLVDRVRENFNEEYISIHFPEESYELTTEGLRFLDENKHLGLWYEDFGIFQELIPIDEYENSYNNLDELIDYINDILKNIITIGDWRKYTHTLELLNQIYELKGDYLSILKNEIEIYLIRINMWESYEDYFPFFRPPINEIMQMKKSVNKAGYSQNELKLFFDEIYYSMKKWNYVTIHEDLDLFISEELSFDYLNKYMDSFPNIESINSEIKNLLNQNVEWINLKR